MDYTKVIGMFKNKEVAQDDSNKKALMKGLVIKFNSNNEVLKNTKK